MPKIASLIPPVNACVPAAILIAYARSSRPVMSGDVAAPNRGQRPDQTHAHQRSEEETHDVEQVSRSRLLRIQQRHQQCRNHNPNTGGEGNTTGPTMPRRESSAHAPAN